MKNNTRANRIYLTDDLMKFYTLDEALSYAKKNEDVNTITEKETFSFNDRELRESVVWTRETLNEKKLPDSVKVKVKDLIKGKYISEDDLKKVDDEGSQKELSSKVGKYLDKKFDSKGKWSGFVFSVDKDKDGKPQAFVCSGIEWDKPLKEQVLNEKNWDYVLKSGIDLRKAIYDEDIYAIKECLIACYDELLENDLIDEYDHDDYVEEVESADFEDEYGFVDEDLVDYLLEQFYDLCDNISVFVAIDESLKLNEGLSNEILDNIYLDEDGFEEFGVGVRWYPYEYSDDDYDELGDNYNYGVMFKDHNIGNVSVCYNDGKDILFIDGMEIKDPNKGLGIGTKVVELLKNEFKDAKKIVLNDTDTSSGFYDKLGFKTSKNQKAGFNRYMNLKKEALDNIKYFVIDNDYDEVLGEFNTKEEAQQFVDSEESGDELEIKSSKEFKGEFKPIDKDELISKALDEYSYIDDEDEEYPKSYEEKIYRALVKYDENHYDTEGRLWQNTINELISEYDSKVNEALERGDEETAKTLQADQDKLYDDAEYCDDHNQPEKAVDLRYQAHKLQKKIDEDKDSKVKKLSETQKTIYLELIDDKDSMDEIKDKYINDNWYIKEQDDEDYPYCIYTSGGYTDNEVEESKYDEIFGYGLDEGKDCDGECCVSECPYCNSSNIDFVDEDDSSCKYICRDCGDDFIVWKDGNITDRHNRPIKESKKSKKSSKKKDKVRFVGDMNKEISFFNRAMGNNTTADGGVGSVAVAESKELNETSDPKFLLDYVREQQGGFDISDDVFDFVNYFECYADFADCEDGYDKVMYLFGSNIKVLKFQPDWYSICNITEFIETNIDAFNEFLNQVYREEYQPQNFDRQYTSNDEEFYDIYIEMFGYLLNGSFTDSEYNLLYNILKSHNINESVEETKVIKIENPDNMKEIEIVDKDEDDLGHPIQQGLGGRVGKLMSEDLDKDPTKILGDFIESIDFYLIKNEDGSYSLRDMQGANLGDIESETFDDAYGVANRLVDSAYMNDYYLEDMVEQFRDIMDEHNLQDGKDFNAPETIEEFQDLRNIDEWIDKDDPNFTPEFIEDVKKFLDYYDFAFDTFDVLLSDDTLSKIDLDEIVIDDVDDATRELGSQKMYEMTCYNKDGKKINLLNPIYLICSKKMLDKYVDTLNRYNGKRFTWEFPVSDKQLWELDDEERSRVIKGDDEVEDEIWDTFYHYACYDCESDEEVDELRNQFIQWLNSDRK